MLVFVALIVSLLLYFAITFFQVVRIDVTLHWCRWQNISCKERTCDCQVPLLYIRLNCQLVTLSFHLCGRIQRPGPRQKVSHNRMELMNVLFILFFFFFTNPHWVSFVLTFLLKLFPHCGSVFSLSPMLCFCSTCGLTQSCHFQKQARFYFH